MICPYCGRENPDNLENCDFCGGSLTPPAEPPVAETPPTEPALEALQPMVEPKEPELTPIQPAKPASGGIYGTRLWWIIGCVVFICIVLACIAGAISIYRNTKLFSFLNPSTETPELPSLLLNTSLPPGTPLASAQQTPKVLFFDDFSDPNSGWDQVDKTDYSTNYYNSAYRIAIGAEMSDSWANPEGHTFSSVVTEVEATKNGGPDDNDFGLICRYRDADRFYYGVISSDGYYGILKVTSESTTVLGRENLEYSDLIKQGLTTNTIRFDCVGEVLTLYVNGQQLDQQSDSEYTSGNVGLIAGTYKTSGTDILFDNFTVYSP